MSRIILNKFVKQFVNQGLPQRSHLQVIARNGGHAAAYRTANINHSKATIIGSKVIGAFMWWWITWHIYKQYDHIIGEFPYPNRSKWSNKELGVPSDNA